MVSHTMQVVVAPPTRNPKPKRIEAPKQELRDTFVEAMLESPCEYKPRNPLEWVVSLMAHGLVVAGLIIAPLYFTQSLDLKAFQNTWLVTPAPPPPAPPPAPAMMTRTVKSVARLMTGGKMMAPSVIPKQVAIIKEAPLPPDNDVDGLVGGVPGGIPGGQVGGVLGGIIGGTGHSASPAVAPPPPPMKRVVRVGGDLKPPKQTYNEEPRYPVIAKQAQIQGTVIIDAVIDEHGDVVQARVVSGPALLIPSALQTVLKWKYEPSYLNGEPISVEMHVEVHFVLQ
jgi:periplasmic protein TonB